MDGWIFELVFSFRLVPTKSFFLRLVPKKSLFFRLVPEKSFSFRLVPKKSLFSRLVPKKSFLFRLVPENSPILSVWQIHSGHAGLLQVRRLLTFCDPCQQFKENSDTIVEI